MFNTSNILIDITPIVYNTLIKGNLFSTEGGSQKAKKYQELSMKVSIVSVSRIAGLSHFGHLVFL